MINTRIIHYPKLIERKTYLESVCKNIIWSCKTSKDNITQQIIDQYYIEDPNLWRERTEILYEKIIPDGVPYRKMESGDISCSINHIQSWKDFLQNDSNDIGLFFEDDIILCENFYDILDNILQVSPTFDAMFIGGGFSHSVSPTLTSEKIGRFEFILKGHPATNCLCSYILNKQTAKNMVDYLENNKTVLPIDFEVNYLFKKFDTKVLHIKPMLCAEGSAIGAYKSVQSR